MRFEEGLNRVIIRNPNSMKSLFCCKLELNTKIYDRGQEWRNWALARNPMLHRFTSKGTMCGKVFKRRDNTFVSNVGKIVTEIF